MCENNTTQFSNRVSPGLSSNSDSEDSDFIEKTPKQKKVSNGKFVYLVTYSQADLLKCPSRERFAEIVTYEFNAVKNNDVVQEWACAAGNHKHHGLHYHLSLKLNK